MTDIVIPLGWGSQWKNNELKYSLRSFQKHLSGIGTVYIVTDLSGLPPWMNNIVHIPCADLTNVAATNTFKKILKACNDKRVSENFLLSNDDFFLLKDFEASTFPNYHRGELKEHYDNPKETHYPKSKMNTYSVLNQLDKPKLHYGVHCPMLIDKTKFIQITELFNWNVDAGYLTRSLYGNFLRLEAEYRKDCKINNYLDPDELQAYIEGEDFFSIGDTAINRPMMDFLQSLYPDKSIFEK